MSCFARASTLYKRKGEKVLPQNVTRTDGASPGGETFWKEKILEQEKEKLKGRQPGKLDKWLTPRFTDAPVGSKLIPDRMATIQVGKELTSQEKELLFACLLNREMALTWDM